MRWFPSGVLAEKQQGWVRSGKHVNVRRTREHNEIEKSSAAIVQANLRSGKLGPLVEGGEEASVSRD